MTPAISVGANIYRLRKEARLTQDDLASYLGVTKASVSKWETGQSYPDIELLPKVATYFDTSVDKLLGYEPQLGKAGIKREIARLREAFATQPFAEAHAQCQELVRDYYSCYPLIAQVASLYMNHLYLAGEGERAMLADEGIELCRRIKRNSEASADIKIAEVVEASLLLATGNPQAAVEALEETFEVDAGADVLLANAYSALGQLDDADKTLQGALVQSLVLSLNRLTQLALIWSANPDKAGKVETAYARSLALIDAFDMDELYVNSAAIHLSFAMAFIASGNEQRTLDCLEGYERSCRALEFPIKLHGDDFFDMAEAFIEDVNTLGGDVPRDEALIKKTLVEGVTANRAFAPIADDPRFKRVVKSLEEVAR